MRLNWSKLVFAEKKIDKRKGRVVGYNILATHRLRGKFILVDGLCISHKSKRQKLLTSSYSLKFFGETVFFIDFPVFLSGALRIKILGLSYGFNVSCSKLTESRIKW